MSTTAGIIITFVVAIGLVIWCCLAMSGRISQMEENALPETSRVDLLIQLNRAMRQVEAYRRSENWSAAHSWSMEATRLLRLLSLHENNA